jgi:hypothetical protein
MYMNSIQDWFDFGTKHKFKMLFWALSSVTVYKQNPCFTGWW